MRKRITLICPILMSFFGLLSAQVGINTTSPQQTLQISGSGTGNAQPVVRIDGLNSTNNPAHENASSVKRVFATSTGDLVIADNNQTNKFYRINPLPTTPVPGGTEQVVTSLSFTLDYPSVVHIEGRVGMGITSTVATTALLQDGQARLFGSYYKFTAAPAGVTTNTAFGQAIISHSTNSGGNQLTGEFYTEPRKDLYLPAGNYTLALYGYAQDINMNFSVNSVVQASQYLIVSITPTNY